MDGLVVGPPLGGVGTSNIATGALSAGGIIGGILIGNLARGSSHTNSVVHYGPLRAGDVRHSLADISKARELLGYSPTHGFSDGLAVLVPWYVKHIQGRD